jgi:hypothetical protein
MNASFRHNNAAARSDFSSEVDCFVAIHEIDVCGRSQLADCANPWHKQLQSSTISSTCCNNKKNVVLSAFDQFLSAGGRFISLDDVAEEVSFAEEKDEKGKSHALLLQL